MCPSSKVKHKQCQELVCLWKTKHFNNFLIKIQFSVNAAQFKNIHTYPVHLVYMKLLQNLKLHLYPHNIHQHSTENVPDLITPVTTILNESTNISVSIVTTSHLNTGKNSISEILHTSNTPWAMRNVLLATIAQMATQHKTE